MFQETLSPKKVRITDDLTQDSGIFLKMRFGTED